MQALKQARSSTAGPSQPEAAVRAAAAAAEGGDPAAHPVAAPAAAAVAPAAVASGAVPQAPCAGDAELAVPSVEALDAASIQQLLSYMDNAMSAVLQVCVFGMCSCGCIPVVLWEHTTLRHSF